MRIAARRRDLLSISNYSIGVLPPNCGSKYATTPPAPRPALSHVEGEFPQGKERSSRGEVFFPYLYYAIISMKKILLSLLLLPAFSSAQIITTIAGNGTAGFSGEGAAVNATFSVIDGIGIDKHGNIYIADWLDNVVQKIDTNGILTRFAGNGFSGLGGDGLATAAQLELYLAVGIIADSIGNVYFGDGSRVRMVNTSGIISTVAGIGLYGFSGDGDPATAAELKAPAGLAFDKSGDLYIADEEASNIRKINTSGVISTFAGTTLGFSGDGGSATNAQFESPVGIAIDDFGNMYIADQVGRIRRIDTVGIITTIAGGDSLGHITCAGGMGCPATSMDLYGACGLSVDHSGNIYTSTIVYNAVHEISKNGLVYTIAGTGTAGYSGDGCGI